MTAPRMFTYQTRVSVSAEVSALLDSYAGLYGQVERALFARMQKRDTQGTAIKPDLSALKREFQVRFGITARQFNAVRASLQGKIASIEALRKDRIGELERKVKRAQAVIQRHERASVRGMAATRAKALHTLHQKKRRLAILESKLERTRDDAKTGRVRLCFGSRKLFRAQFDLEANGYENLDAWRDDWRLARDSQFFVLGSKDESAGNQSCQAKVEDDGTFTLKLRLPHSIATDGLCVTIPGVRFAYGHEDIVDALASSRRISAQTNAGKPVTKLTGTAISYRFVRDEKGWRVFASAEKQPPKPVTHQLAGAIGVDINADHLAIAEIDACGNLIRSKRIELLTYGLSQDQAKARIGDACVAIAKQAAAAGKPVVHEALDFAGKKADLESAQPKHARMLSSFAYGRIVAGLQAACFRAGVETISVNPAYTSVIGAVNHAKRHGITVHMAAAFAIARRGLGYSERPTVRHASVPHKRGHVTFALPVRNRAKHVWSFWSSARKTLKAALAGQGRSVRGTSSHWTTGSKTSQPASSTVPSG